MKNSIMGFTLVEIMIVVIIIGILASISLPLYTKTKENALGKEAIANLKLIAAAEKIYQMEMNSYVACANTSAVNSNLKLAIPTGNPNWDYTVSSDGTTFIAYADRVGSGGYLNCQYSLAYNDADGEPEKGASCP